MDLQQLYNKSPYFMQSVLFKLYTFSLYIRRNGKEFSKAVEELNQTQWYSRSELIEYQNERLARLIQHAYDTVPYYRDVMKKRKLKPEDVKAVKDLYKLPILTREDVLANRDRLISQTYREKELIHGHTSGTTGSPLQFFWDKKMWVWNHAFDWRQKVWAGVCTGDPLAVALGRTIVNPQRTHPPFWQYNPFENQIWLSSFHLSRKNIKYFLNKLKTFSPVAIEGYPSTVSLIASLLEEIGETLDLKATFTSSETLYDEQLEVMRRIFNCENFDFYGLAERVIFATECEAHCGKHLNMEYGITEVVDEYGEVMPEGEAGFLVGTSLLNYGMPFIRYKTSDICWIRKEECICGRKMPLLGRVTTKAEDIIITLDGRFISPSMLTHPFKPLQNINLSQIIQERVDSIIVKIVKRNTFSKQDAKRLIDGLAQRIGPNVSIRLKFVDNIPREKSGKFKWVISKVGDTPRIREIEKL